ncbi:MAG: hypothetical protein ACYTGH_16185, partial [Planctomycetota bacterium]
MLVWGGYLLLWRLTQSRSLAVLLSLLLLFSSPWLNAIGFNFKMIYLLPLALASSEAFWRAEREQPYLFWSGLFFFTMLQFGSVPSYFAVTSLVFIGFNLYLGWKCPSRRRPIFHGKAWIGFGLIILLCTGEYILSGVAFIQHHVLVRPNRDPSTSMVTLSEYLINSTNLKDYATTWSNLIIGDPRIVGATLYCGLLPLFAALYAAIRLRNRPVTWICLVLLGLCLLTMQMGLTSVLMYYINPLFRGIRYTMGHFAPIRVLLIMIAAGVLKRWHDSPPIALSSAKRFRYGLVGLVIILAAADILMAKDIRDSLLLGQLTTEMKLLVVFALRVLLYVSCIWALVSPTLLKHLPLNWRRPRTAILALVTCCLLDVLTFHGISYQFSLLKHPHRKALISLYQTRPLQWQERELQASGTRAQQALACALNTQYYVLDLDNPFAQADVPFMQPTSLLSFSNRHVEAFLSQTNTPLLLSKDNASQAPSFVAKSLGWDGKKLKLLRSPLPNDA